MKRFEVQHLTLANGWVNTWSDDKGSPVWFNTRSCANRELSEYLYELRKDIRSGRIRSYEQAEFRVAAV